ncbi:MAG: sigma-70 family RNA polymerase sigma factor [Firmicutes bacterium]|nr:sigma-70 family RNA polymerase sigma factor [Bacillota bacterium]
MQIEIRGLERLSFRERQVVVLKESGKSNEEVAQVLAVTPATVATLYKRARSKGYQVVAVLPLDTLGLAVDPAEEGER